MFSGYQFGGLVADTFAKSSNPIKVAFLKSIGKSEPEIYSIMKEFTSKANVDKWLRKGLPASTKGTSPDLMRMANERGAVEMGFTPHKADTFGNNLIQNDRIFRNTKMLPAPSPRIITPNTRGTPNKISNLYERGGDKGDVGGLRQIKKS